MLNIEIRELQEGLGAALTRVLASLEGIEAAEAHEVPAPDEWTVVQLLAHIAEIQGFWTAKAVEITREDDPNITRTEVENDIRLAAVEGQAQDSLADLIQRAAEANSRAIGTVGGIDPGDLERPGHRGEDNPITVKGVIEYVARHVEEHAVQIAESLRLIRRRI